MRAQWEAAQAGLRVFLEEDGEYANFLESIEKNLARKLRFEYQSRGGSHVESVAFDRFLEVAAQIWHIHAFFQSKLRAIAEPLARGPAGSVEEKCNSFVEILADMLSLLRMQYGQLFCRREATQAAFDAALANNIREWDGKVLEKYLAKQQLTADKLVDRPLQRFEELVEFVEALSKTLSEDGIDGALSNDSDMGTEEKLNYAPQLMHIVQETKHYIHLVKANAREEKELISLQSCFYGDGAEAFHDLSDNKLLLHGEVFLSQSDRSGADSETATSITGSFSQPEDLYLHCFQDGTLVCSKRQCSESGSAFTILRRLHLKQDAAFLEFVPSIVPIHESLEETCALALILQDTTLVFSWRDASEYQQWSDTIGGFLEMNGSRAENLHQGRSIDALPVPEDISAQLVETDTIPTKFASFYDDHLPGVFWMMIDDASKSRWELVEIVFYVRWLVVFKLDGWKRHSALCQFDTHAPEIEISEQPRGDKEWSLVISNGSAGSLTLVSKKRTRIDFWFDQVWKAIENAQVETRRTEREKRERKEMEEEEQSMRVERKKRKLQTVSDKDESAVDATLNSSSNASPAGSNNSKPDDKTDEEYGELDKSTSSIVVAEELIAALPVSKKSRRLSDKPKPISAAASAEKDTCTSSIVSPAVTTPKRRWLKRKSEDPDDTALIPTQPSSSIPTDETTSEIDTLQLPANEAAAEEPRTQEVRIILTGIEPTAAIRKKIDSIAGALYEEDIEKATHILAPKNQLKRTVKLLCGISRSSHVLDVRWLDESARVGAPVYERAHCLKDSKAEAKWKFDLLKTMYDYTPEQRQQLFTGHRVFITNHKSVLPPVKDLVKIVECAGGVAVTKGSADPNDVVITSDAALVTASVRKALTQANPQRIYSAELILSGILQQHIDFDQNRLEQSGGGSSRRRR
ncbi:uncharacterized protein PITG_00197 [Phytophthora infestans T30-4]|uniref:BRCT domain-containing protein n=2 Tax=Phytophthora infestans TaxID=4787 RepID=D0MQ67_PHYIT|nr:uncharacterized protein PITG_00197 [Phytophthora infestans T30-4]EEY57636.1 conserved hypothetical protein [Phytophthora infestans T30-4]KAF4033152.1 hypothetical protein GN244_ATG14849 [Phytophthora infestans]KAF4138358.1 hypothetical protein GN958_ATG12512 [Phytophthora infestans]|eukprot:XP_002908822.1 conserved hypothetical protein [Phytophthora infestans T30-4]